MGAKRKMCRAAAGCVLCVIPVHAVLKCGHVCAVRHGSHLAASVLGPANLPRTLSREDRMVESLFMCIYRGRRCAAAVMVIYIAWGNESSEYSQKRALYRWNKRLGRRPNATRVPT